MSKQRQIVLDTETTGLVPEEGHKIIEIGGIELINRRFTGNNFHIYINPCRGIDKEALAVHGLSEEFLADKPVFPEILDDFLTYVTGAELIIHNAPFDVGFLNYEISLCQPNAEPLADFVEIFDTLSFARKKHPGQRNSLDALCKRYKVDNSKRELHGALLDARLLAEVYLAMTGGQTSLFGEEQLAQDEQTIIRKEQKTKLAKPLRIIRADNQEQEAHRAYLHAIQKQSGRDFLWDDGGG